MSAGLFARRLQAPALWLGLGLAAFSAQFMIGQSLPLNPSVEEAGVPNYLGNTIDPRVVSRLLGVRVAAADLVWVDALIKSDIARTPESNRAFYRAFKTLVSLDPDNLYAYYTAGLYLSVVKDDVRAATLILRDGAKHMETHPHSFPDAWKVPFALGYNLLFEEHEVEEGSYWIRRAGELPRVPLYVKALAQRMETEHGQLEIGSKVLMDFYRRMESPEAKARIEAKLADIAARQQILELNSKFQQWLSSTGAYAFPKGRQFDLFMKSNGHPRKDLRGRPLYMNASGRIEPKSN